MASRDEIINAAGKMAEFLRSAEFKEEFKAKVDKAGILFANQLFESLEEEQVKAIDSWELPHSGAKTLQYLKMAVRSYPSDEGVKTAVMQLVTAEESLLDEIQKIMAEKHGIPQGQPMQQGGGAPGQPGAPGQMRQHPMMPQLNPQQMAMMNMAQQSLSDQQKKDLQQLQMKMMSGQRPTPQDQQKMMAIQQHMVAYVSTMQAAMNNAAKAQAGKQQQADGANNNAEKKE